MIMLRRGPGQNPGTKKLPTRFATVSCVAFEWNLEEFFGNYMRKWQCIVCGWIYDEALGLEEEGIPPGTSWDDIPDDFCCPECGVGKEDFEMIEIA